MCATSVCVSVCMCASMWSCVCILMRVCVCVCVFMRMVCTWMHLIMCMCGRPCSFFCMCVYMRVCMCACMHVSVCTTYLLCLWLTDHMATQVIHQYLQHTLQLHRLVKIFLILSRNAQGHNTGGLIVISWNKTMVNKRLGALYKMRVQWPFQL